MSFRCRLEARFAFISAYLSLFGGSLDAMSLVGLRCERKSDVLDEEGTRASCVTIE